jgi:hypothetical protein
MFVVGFSSGLATFSQIYLFITAVVSAAGPGSGSGTAEVQVLSSDAIVTSSGSPLRLLWSPESVFLFVVVVCFS